MTGLGWRIKTAADRLGGLDYLAPRLPSVSRRTLSDWANDKTEPRASAILEIAEATGVSPAWLLVGDGQMFLDSGTVTPFTSRQSAAGGKRLDVSDIERLERAIAIIEQALADVNREASPQVKAGMISAAFEMLEDQSDQTVGRILRLVKG